MSVEKSVVRAKSGTGPAVDFSGRWKNELGSIVEVSQRGDLLKGHYESAVSAGETKTAGQLRGYVDGSLVSFVVHWDDFQAITAWVGQLDVGSTDSFSTLWQMTKAVDAGDQWESINAGADSFKRQP